MSEQEREDYIDIEAEEEGEEDEVQERAESNPYTIIGVEPDATPAQVRVAYFQKVREHSPERDPEGFKRVREAYETLRSPRKRAELTLLELRRGPTQFDLDRLRDVPPPPVPERFADHLLAIALAQVDAEIDDEVARARDAADLVALPSASGAGGEG